jgi:hypothetical protein
MLEKLLSRTVPEGDCLLWSGCLNTDGYPRASVRGNANVKVHRMVYELATGINPEGRCVRHTCDNPRCINPKHLVLGTVRDNMTDRTVRERGARNKLTSSQVREIRALYSDGWSQARLAEKFSVNYRTIHYVVKGKTWMWVS